MKFDSETTVEKLVPLVRLSRAIMTDSRKEELKRLDFGIIVSLICFPTRGNGLVSY